MNPVPHFFENPVKSLGWNLGPQMDSSAQVLFWMCAV